MLLIVLTTSGKKCRSGYRSDPWNSRDVWRAWGDCSHDPRRMATSRTCASRGFQQYRNALSSLQRPEGARRESGSAMIWRRYFIRVRTVQALALPPYQSRHLRKQIPYDTRAIWHSRHAVPARRILYGFAYSWGGLFGKRNNDRCIAKP